jgi:hypothetical protein
LTSIRATSRFSSASPNSSHHSPRANASGGAAGSQVAPAAGGRFLVRAGTGALGRL